MLRILVKTVKINVVTDRPNVKDPLISGGTLQEDAQESSDAEEQDKIQRKVMSYFRATKRRDHLIQLYKKY